MREPVADRYPDFWDVTLGWIPGPGELGCYAEAGIQIEVGEDCPTAEAAIVVCREARKIHGRVLDSISVKRMTGSLRP